jgi:hypothetical protein
MNKGNQQAKADRPTIDRIYGSHAVAGAATKILLLNKGDTQITSSGKERKVVEVQLARSRHTRDRNESFEFDASETRWSEIGVKPL